MPSERKQLYGWPAPVNIGIYGALFLFFAGSLLALAVALAILTLVWGPPPAPPLLSLHLSRPLLMGTAGLTIFLFWHSKRRAVVIVLCLLILSAVPLYSPHFVVVALAGLLRNPTLSGTLVLSASLATGIGLVMLVAREMKDLFRFTTTGMRGSTDWGRGEILHLAEEGMLLGTKDGKMLRYNGGGHLLTVAATRSGKGVGTIMPNLLNYAHSVVVTDPKGENYYVTSRYRRETLHQQVMTLDPFGLTRKLHPDAAWAFNPLDMIDLQEENYVEMAMMMADMMVVRRSNAADIHWNLEARALLYALILYVASYKNRARRNLIEVRRLLTLQTTELDKILNNQMLRSTVEQVCEGAGRILQKADRERSGVFSTAQSHTHFLSSPSMQRVLTETNIDLCRLPEGSMSLYLVLPREYLSTFAPWLRLMITCCYHVCSSNAMERGQTGKRVLFLLDEFANLGYMENIKEAVSLGAGYGISLWLVLQDLAQLRREYRDEWESFVANSDVFQSFAIQDPYTSEKVARMLGETTVWQRRMRKASRREGGRYVKTYDEQSRPLLRADELRRLHPKRQLLLLRSYQPVLADKIVYYTHPFFRGRFDTNPYITRLSVPGTLETMEQP